MAHTDHPRTRKTPQQRAQATLAAAQGRLERASQANVKAIKAANDATEAKTAAAAELEAAKKALAYAQMNPELPKPAATS
jgi:hypothetical protein